MSHSPEGPDHIQEDPDEARRCPTCDSVVAPSAEHCLMCGAALAGGVFESAEDKSASQPAAGLIAVQATEPAPDMTVAEMALEPSIGEQTEPTSAESGEPELDAEPGVVESRMVERQSPITLWLTALFVIVIVVIGVLMLQNPAVATLAIFPTETAVPPTITLTPTWTPLPTETEIPTETPTITPTLPPTATPQPPRAHAVTAGETLFAISLRYGVSMESIAAASGIAPDAALQVSQQLLIPWPTAAPPLEPVEVDIGGETIIADPTDCRIYEIKGGDTFFGIAARERIDLRAVMAVNRLTEQSVLQPGDTICIPTIIRGGVLPPTPGPSPTASETPPPPGPSLLYPVREAEVLPPDAPFFLQWAAVKDLAEDEWYMVEMTDLSAIESHPLRGFTRQTSFQVPSTWRPPVDEQHLIRWRVTLVRVTGQRQDGSFVYTFGGNSSQDAYFTWMGAVPTPTPTPTATPSATPQS